MNDLCSRTTLECRLVGKLGLLLSPVVQLKISLLFGSEQANCFLGPISLWEASFQNDLKSPWGIKIQRAKFTLWLLSKTYEFFHPSWFKRCFRRKQRKWIPTERVFHYSGFVYHFYSHRTIKNSVPNVNYILKSAQVFGKVFSLSHGQPPSQRKEAHPPRAPSVFQSLRRTFDIQFSRFSYQTRGLSPHSSEFHGCSAAAQYSCDLIQKEKRWVRSDMGMLEDVPRGDQISNQLHVFRNSCLGAFSVWNANFFCELWNSLPLPAQFAFFLTSPHPRDILMIAVQQSEKKEIRILSFRIWTHEDRTVHPSIGFSAQEIWAGTICTNPEDILDAEKKEPSSAIFFKKWANTHSSLTSDIFAK